MIVYFGLFVIPKEHKQSVTGSVPVHKWRDGRGGTYWGGGTYCFGPTEEAFLHFSALNFICSAGELRRKYDLIPLARTATCLHKRDCDHRVTGITSAQHIPKERRSVVSALRLARRKRRCDIIRFIHKELQQTVNCKPSVNTMRYPSVESAVCWPWNVNLFYSAAYRSVFNTISVTKPEIHFTADTLGVAPQSNIFVGLIAKTEYIYLSAFITTKQFHNTQTDRT